jgi:hypothetical protein
VRALPLAATANSPVRRLDRAFGRELEDLPLKTTVVAWNSGARHFGTAGNGGEDCHFPDSTGHSFCSIQGPRWKETCVWAVEGEEKRIALPSSLFLEVPDRADGKIWGSIDNSDKDYYVLWLCWNETDPSWDRPILGQSWYLKLKNCIDVEYHGG